ncbi:hypothetical protein ABE50_19670 [Bacillus wiedmannii]|nr:hypothetical protein [Bacillus wiedmannii]
MPSLFQISLFSSAEEFFELLVKQTGDVSSEIRKFPANSFVINSVADLFEQGVGGRHVHSQIMDSGAKQLRFVFFFA